MEKNSTETPAADRKTPIPIKGPTLALADASGKPKKTEELAEKLPRDENSVIRRKRRHSRDSSSRAARPKKIKTPIKKPTEKRRRGRKRRPIETGLPKSSSQKRDVKEEAKSKTSDEQYQKHLEYLTRFGKNFYCPVIKRRTGLRPIYIDGSNVAFSHGQNESFSVAGLEICIDYFRKRGHEVKAFVPHYRLRRGETSDQALLHKLVMKKLVITTPTLYIQNQRRNPYDDWYIVQTAAANGGIIVSADNFQDIVKWNPNLRTVVEERRLVPTFVDDMLIFPVDPHGNRQNNLEQFLRF